MIIYGFFSVLLGVLCVLVVKSLVFGKVGGDSPIAKIAALAAEPSAELV